MYCDALTLAAVADELRRELVGGRIQEALLVDRHVVGLEVYAHGRQYLLLSARPEEGGRVHLVRNKLRRGVESPSPLLLRLRKEARGGHLIDVQQPPLERLLRLDIEGPAGSLALIVEVMGQRSNIILLEADGTILECARHVTASQNRYRVLLPGHSYVPPPSQKKASALTLTASRLAKLLGEQKAELPLWQKLVATLSGVSPLLAREVAYRASGDAACPQADAATVLAHLQDLLGLVTTRKWQPTVALQGDEAVAYAPYVLTQYAQREGRTSTSEAMEVYYAQLPGKDAYAVAKSRVQELIEKQRERQLRKKEALLSAYPGPGTLEELRKRGELLLAYAHQVRPKQTELVVHWSQEEPPVHIALDPSQSAIENAREYFRRYEKAKSAAAELPGLLAYVDDGLAYLDQLATDLALAEDRPGIAAVESALAEAGGVQRPVDTSRRKKVTRGAATPLHVVSEHGFTILVGRNSWQNEEVTFHRGMSHDVWLHATAVPGAHVVVRTEGRDLPESTLRQAAELAAYFSAARHDKQTLVDYTLRKNVRRPKGGRQGQVVYKGQKTICVRPQDALIIAEKERG